MSKIDLGEVDSTTTTPKRCRISGDITGAVSNIIGTGKHAQDSVVWLTIKWSFGLGLGLSLALLIFMWPSSPDGIHPPIEAKFPIDHLKTIWSIFVPIITLALGYMFGKGK